MKKTLSIVLLVLLVFLAVACNPEVAEHEHDWKYTKKTTATCKAPGYVEKECTICGLKWVSEVDEVLDHDFVKVDELSEEPTCAAEGVYIYECSMCGVLKKEVQKKSDTHILPDLTSYTNYGGNDAYDEYKALVTDGIKRRSKTNYTYSLAEDEETKAKMSATCVSVATYTGLCMNPDCTKTITFTGKNYNYTASGHGYQVEGEKAAAGVETILSPDVKKYHCTACTPETKGYWNDESADTTPYKATNGNYVYASIVGIWMDESGNYLRFVADAEDGDSTGAVSEGVYYGTLNTSKEENGYTLNYCTETVDSYTWGIDSTSKKRTSLAFTTNDSLNGTVALSDDGKTLTVDSETYTLATTDEIGTSSLSWFDSTAHYYAHVYKDGNNLSKTIVVKENHKDVKNNSTGDVKEDGLCDVCGKKIKDIVSVTIKTFNGEGLADNPNTAIVLYVEKVDPESETTNFKVEKTFVVNRYIETAANKTFTVDAWYSSADEKVEGDLKITENTILKLYRRTY